VIGAAGAGVAVLLVGAGFLAGTQFGGDRGDTTRLVSDQSGPLAAGGYGAPGGRDGGQGLPGGQLPGDPDGDGDGPLGGAAAASFVTAGQITAISGSTITLSTFRGGSATVTTTSSTTVGGSAGGSLSSLAVGQVIFVAGTKTGDGSYQATAIMTRPTGAAGGLSHGDRGADRAGTSNGEGTPAGPGDAAQGTT
jgi:hypothetical protein